MYKNVLTMTQFIKCECRTLNKVKILWHLCMTGWYVGGNMFYLCYLCLFVYSGVQHILYCVFVWVFFVLLPVSLDCPFLIAPSVFSNLKKEYPNLKLRKQKTRVPWATTLTLAIWTIYIRTIRFTNVANIRCYLNVKAYQLLLFLS